MSNLHTTDACYWCQLVDETIDNLLSKGSTSKLDQRYLRGSSGNYTLRELLLEVKAGSEVGQVMQRNLILLAIDLLSKQRVK